MTYKDLAALTDFVPSDLKRACNNTLADKGIAIYNAAIPIAPQLAGYLVSSQEIELLFANIQSYLAAIPFIRNLQAASKQSTTTIGDKINEGKAILDDVLDNLMLYFQTANPALYGEYQNNRIIIDTASGRKKDENGDTPIPPAQP